MGIVAPSGLRDYDASWLDILRVHLEGDFIFSGGIITRKPINLRPSKNHGPEGVAACSLTALVSG